MVNDILFQDRYFKNYFFLMHKIQLSLRYGVEKPVKSQTYKLLYLTEL
jgi:hypothetical protein